MKGQNAFVLTYKCSLWSSRLADAFCHGKCPHLTFPWCSSLETHPLLPRTSDLTLFLSRIMHPVATFLPLPLSHCFNNVAHKSSSCLNKFSQQVAHTLGWPEGRRGQRLMRWLDSITNSMGMNPSKLRELVDRAAWHAAVRGIKRQTQLSDWTSRKIHSGFSIRC